MVNISCKSKRIHVLWSQKCKSGTRLATHCQYNMFVRRAVQSHASITHRRRNPHTAYFPTLFRTHQAGMLPLVVGHFCALPFAQSKRGKTQRPARICLLRGVAINRPSRAIKPPRSNFARALSRRAYLHWKRWPPAYRLFSRAYYDRLCYGRPQTPV